MRRAYLQQYNISLSTIHCIFHVLRNINNSKMALVWKHALLRSLFSSLNLSPETKGANAFQTFDSNLTVDRRASYRFVLNVQLCKAESFWKIIPFVQHHQETTLVQFSGFTDVCTIPHSISNPKPHRIY